MVSGTAPILPPSTAEHECQPQYMVTYDVYSQMMGQCSGHFAPEHAAQTQKHDDVYSLCWQCHFPLPPPPSRTVSGRREGSS